MKILFWMFMLTLLVLGLVFGCQGTDITPHIGGDLGGDFAPEIEQSSNNPWPWMLTVLGIVVVVFAYLYFSTKFTGFGRKPKVE